MNHVRLRERATRAARLSLSIAPGEITDAAVTPAEEILYRTDSSRVRQEAVQSRGRASGRTRSNPVVIATLEGNRYLVSMLGSQSEWVKNLEASNGGAVIRQGRRRHVHLVPVAAAKRAPILREYVRVATSGRTHFSVPVSPPLSEFEAIAERYPVYRIDLA